MKRPEGRSLFVLLVLHVQVVITPTCRRAEYLIGQECCPMCPPGTRVNKHCTKFRRTLCVPCDEGTYMDEPTGRTQCSSCRICASGSGLKATWECSDRYNALCEPLEGCFCEKHSEDDSCASALKHRSCEPGQFILQPGSASADTQCSPCAEGTFSDGTLSKCQPHTQCEQLNKVTLKDGNSSSDAECGERSSTPVIIGIIVGLVLAAIAVVVTGVLFRKKIKEILNNSHTPPADQDMTEREGLGPDNTKPIFR